MLPQAIIFDWDNTLVNTQFVLDFALKKTLAKMGFSIEENKKIINSRQHYSSRDQFLKTEFKYRWQEAKLIYERNIRNSPSGGICLFANVKAVLQFIFKKNIPTVVVSNKFGHDLRAEVKKLQLEKYFISVIGSGDSENDKPSVLPAMMALKEASIELHRNIFFIGDNATDMECARRLGVQKILYGKNRTDGIIADYYVEDHAFLLQFLKDKTSVN